MFSVKTAHLGVYDAQNRKIIKPSRNQETLRFRGLNGDSALTMENLKKKKKKKKKKKNIKNDIKKQQHKNVGSTDLFGGLH